MLRGETLQRSPFDADDLSARLQAHGVAQLAGEPDIWVVLDGSDLRKPHAQQMEALQRVRRLDGNGMVPGYRTLAAIGVWYNPRQCFRHRTNRERLVRQIPQRPVLAAVLPAPRAFDGHYSWAWSVDHRRE